MAGNVKTKSYRPEVFEIPSVAPLIGARSCMYSTALKPRSCSRVTALAALPRLPIYCKRQIPYHCLGTNTILVYLSTNIGPMYVRQHNLSLYFHLRVSSEVGFLPLKAGLAG